MLKYILIIKLWVSLIIDIELKPYQKSCLSKTFNLNEPVRFEVKYVKGKLKNKSLIMNVETREEKVVSHYHEVGIAHSISFNNQFRTHLFFCVDNLENQTYRLTKIIKHSYKIGNDKDLAKEEDSLELLDNAKKTLHRLNTVKNLHNMMVEKINKKKDLHLETEKVLTFTGIIMLVIIVIIGIAQIVISKREFSSKKIY